ncbi:uncharacterized protein LOC131433725 [Malaya genurostris]|uniref:uncharacterized protein LOC131433725 n=1 Tax=Malaya genurostris TaxID=325434 RepID=UPI0026F3A052|nr:uncharacterized protein LOC131433725 [Malaya genurostris]
MSLRTKFVLMISILGILSVCGQEKQKPITAANETTLEEVVVETSLYVRRKPASVSRLQQLSPKEKGIPRTKREISHSIAHTDSKLKSNALNPNVGHQKHSVEHTNDFVQSFFDKGFTNGAAKRHQLAFQKQKSVTPNKQISNQLA